MIQTIGSLDVCIIGDGFAGMNAARILAGQGIKCEIFTSNMGSSRFWVGTVDFLNKEGSDLEADFNQFKEQLPAHPYFHLKFKESARYLREFFTAFPEFVAFTELNLPVNELVLTTLGTQKPCIGAWGTIFRDFLTFKAHTLAVLVDFQEFNNSMMNLVAKGLACNFEGKFKVVRLSLRDLVRQWENAPKNSITPLKLNENQIAQYFDKHTDKCEVLVELIRSGIRDQITTLRDLPITCILFPPILGLQNTTEILRKLTGLLGVKVGELVAFSPSLMSHRFYQKFDDKLKNLAVDVHKGYTLQKLERNSGGQTPTWTCTFEDAKGAQTHVFAKYVILATGSLFNQGCLASDETLRATLERYALPVPNPFTSSFEFVSPSSPTQRSCVFACGSATYLIRGGITDEEEIRYGTGLGLAIITSAKVAEQIFLREDNAKYDLDTEKRDKITD